MDNTNLYKFSFVDREESSKKLAYILEHTTKLPIIVGKHGVGKTFFIDNFFKKNPGLKYIYITFNAEEKEQNGVLKFLATIEKQKSLTFFDYFSINYRTIFRIAGNQIVKKVCDDFFILCNMLKNSVSVKDKNGFEKSIAEILVDYLVHMYVQEKNIIIFDNFHLCDKASLEIIIPIIKKSLEKGEHFQFIISLTLEGDDSIKYKLEESIPREEIEILEFNNFMYFYEILFDILDISDQDKELISKIYEYCNGNPQQLLNFIHKLDSAKALVYSEKHRRAEINHEKANLLLCDDSSYLPFTSFSFQQRCILYVIIEFGVLLPLELLNEIVKYVMQKTFFCSQYKEEAFFSEAIDLLDKGVIKFIQRDSIQFIKMEHDLKLNYYKKEIENIPMFNSFHLYLYEYIMQNQENFLKDDIGYLITLHSYKGQVTNWQTTNYLYGKELFDKKDFINAANIFLRLKESLQLFSFSEKLIIIETFYNNGKYSDAKDIIEKIQESELDDANLFFYLYLKTKVCKFCLKQSDAEQSIEQLLQLKDLDQEMYIQILSLEERVFSNSSNNRQRAFEAYEKIKNSYIKNINVETIYGSCLKTSIEFYRGELAQNDLQIAFEIAKKNGDFYEVGAIYTNKGFDLFWQGQIDEALFYFQEAYDTLINVAEYEVSYPLNNMANCYILMGDYDNAIHYLKAALYWNKSEYVKITLNILLAYCFAITNRNYDIDTDAYFSYILSNINSSAFSDISIRIKVNYLMGCIYDVTGNPIKAQIHKEKAFNFAKNHNPQYLPYIWMFDYNEEIAADIQKRLPRNKFDTYYKRPFDPWLVTLSHD